MSAVKIVIKDLHKVPIVELEELILVLQREIIRQKLNDLGAKQP